MGAGQAVTLTHIQYRVCSLANTRIFYLHLKGQPTTTGPGREAESRPDTDKQPHTPDNNAYTHIHWPKCYKSRNTTWTVDATVRLNSRKHSNFIRDLFRMHYNACNKIIRPVGHLWRGSWPPFWIVSVCFVHVHVFVSMCVCIQGLVPGSLWSPSTTVGLFFSGASENRINDQLQGHEKVVSTSHRDFTARVYMWLRVCWFCS